MTKSIRLRLAEPSDADAVARLFLAARRTALPYLPELHVDAETYAWMERVVFATTTVWVALLGDRIVGFLSLAGDSVEHLYVDPARQRRGVGSALLAKAKSLSPTCLQLWTFQRNAAARTFYEAHGFVAVKFTDGADNEEREPDVRYEWRPAAATADRWIDRSR